MTTKLALYNRALLYCKERSLSSLTESREPRRLLDEVYDQGGIEACLEEGLWKFATRGVKLDYDTSLTREFGYLYGFEKPTDWQKTVSMCSDEYFRTPLLDYIHENGFWYADLQCIYVRYVSNDTLNGYAIGSWPRSFANYVAAHFAEQIVGKLTADPVTIAAVMKWHEDNRKIAKGNDAWNQPQMQPAPGAWSRSRRDRGRGNDFGNRGTLLG